VAQSRHSHGRTAIAENPKNRTAQLFHEALALEPDQQSAFLKDACADDGELFRRVKDLLDSYAEVSTIGPTTAKPKTELLDSDTLLALGERYECISPIGRGGMGVVFRAHDRELDKVVALKVLHPSLADDERAIERFRNEIRLAHEITHKNVCRTYGLERVNGKILISMEFVEGETLRSILDRVRGVSVPQGVSWTLEICAGLAAAHDKGIVHRDLKPENIMIDRQGHAKVMDFGIARSIQAGDGIGGTVIGTPQYMSPEQARGKAITPASDIYSVGLMLYELFTGARWDPEKRSPPSEVNPYLPAYIDDILRKCLEDDPKLRFQSASELITAVTAQGRTSAQRLGLIARTLKLVVISSMLAVVIVSLLVFRNNRQSVAGMRHERVGVITFSADDRTLASGSEDTTIKLWDVQGEEERHTLTGHDRGVNCLAFSGDNHWLASGSGDRTVRIWNVETGQLLKMLPDTDKKTIAHVALSRDGTRLASTTGDTVNIWDVQAGRIEQVVKHEDQVNDIVFSPDGRLLASGGDDNKVKIWNVVTGQLERDLAHEQSVTAVAFSPDGRWLAAAVDKEIKMWSRQTWVIVHSLPHDDTVANLSFRLDGQRLASKTEDHAITLWTAPSWDRPQSRIKFEPDEEDVAFSPDLKRFAVAHNDGRISLRALP
jgi:Protein kinase domain/WD domain, G-beta repeat